MRGHVSRRALFPNAAGARRAFAHLLIGPAFNNGALARLLRNYRV